MSRINNVDRETEIALFEAMLTGQTSEHILMMCAGSGWGKSILLREFERGRALLYLGQPEQALEAYRQGLDVPNKPSDLDDAIDDLQEMLAQADAPAGTAQALKLLQGWIAAFQQSKDGREKQL